MQIQVAQRTFIVPRKIIGSIELPNRQYDRSWRCENGELKASSIQIVVFRNTGNEFYDEWVQNRKLPNVIRIERRGHIKNHSDQFLLWAQNAGRPTVRDEVGYDVTKSASETLYDVSPLGLFGFDGHKIVFQCSTYEFEQSHGHTCRTSYPYDEEIDIVYSFQDGYVPKDDWLNLDTRVRKLLRDLGHE
ncbi:MAG: hypothetical protein J0I13_12580 [Rhizobiales bacterium]|nr:hypothetical protein [Hyphomicrobiales bacterium]